VAACMLFLKWNYPFHANIYSLIYFKSNTRWTKQGVDTISVHNIGQMRQFVNSTVPSTVHAYFCVKFLTTLYRGLYPVQV
jgi:hypothetical protein